MPFRSHDLNLRITKIVFSSLSPAEMVDAMKKVASTDVELTVEERNLLSVAYKNVIGARRASWRIISSIEQKEENKGVEEKLEMIKNYRSQVEKELRDICSDILDVLDKHLIPCATTGESKVFYYKMKGDYHRYLAEFATGNDRKEAAENSLVAYKAASDIAMTDLPPTHPIRLGLALNFSVSCRSRTCGLHANCFSNLASLSSPGLLLRNPQCPRSCLSTCKSSVWRCHRRIGYTQWRELQRFHTYYAIT